MIHRAGGPSRGLPAVRIRARRRARHVGGSVEIGGPVVGEPLDEARGAPVVMS